MPIRPENRARYPENWPEISQRIRQRARWRCERCQVPHNALGGRDHDGRFLPAQPLDCARHYPRPGEHGWCGLGARAAYLKIVRIVLTVAHLDHKPENCAENNLQALCQRCHNRLDAATRAAGIKARRRATCAASDLFPPSV